MRTQGLPEWLREAPGPLPSVSAKRRSRRSFVEKTLDEFSRVMQDEFYAERIARSPGLLQGIHPGAKVLTTILLIGVAVSIRSWPVLLLFNLWVLLLARLSSINLVSFLKRVWLVVPLFTGVIILPSLFNYVLPGRPLLVLYDFGHPLNFGPWTFPSYLAITREGLTGGIAFILRVGACVSLAVLLTLTTNWSALLKAFRSLFVPQVFVTVLEMTYRYIYVLLLTVSDMFAARQSRTVGRTSASEQRRFISGAMGTLWEKAFSLSEEVHAAMLSRGYTGEPRPLASFQMQQLDWLWSLLVVIISLITLWGDRLIG
ncbi:MAG: cobalt ECF transporter T component CbiQ [Thermacetogeniaceae bacterium]